MTARTQIGRSTASSQARLQLVLVLLAAWDLLAFFLELGQTRVLRIDGIQGVLGARSVNGAVVVLALAYLYAARNPMRHRFVIWLAALEQVVALFSGAFHWALGDVSAGQAVLPMLIAVIFLVALVAWAPRETSTF
ncbi:MAG: hypothetical protein IVW36_00615 [Dehalococcoidia bacterium]|nr:hypothetical protein [Dehalococcoidia bacterium]